MIKTDTSPESLSEVVFTDIYSVINSLVKLTEQCNQNRQQDHKSLPAKNKHWSIKQIFLMINIQYRFAHQNELACVS